MNNKNSSGKKITLEQISKKAGVSISTVSRVLNGQEGVDVDIKNKVLKLLEENNYLKEKKNKIKKKIISLIIPDITNPFFSSLIEGVEHTAKIHNFYTIISECKNNDLIYQESLKEANEISIAGLIVVPGNGSHQPLKNIIETINMPIIFADRKIDSENINYVGTDNETGAYNATKYLMSLGHKKILYISGPKNVSTETERFFGFTKALEESGISLDEKLYVTGNYNFNESYNEVKKVIEQKTEFTAIFGASDSMCFAAKQAVEESNLQIPKDISMIGHDNIPFSSAINLTTVGVPAYEIGKNAVLLLLDIINARRTAPTNIILQSNIIIRSSCAVSQY